MQNNDKGYSADINLWLQHLKELGSNRIEPGLERVSLVWDALMERRLAADSEFVFPTLVTVAGTNGKGSCIAVLEQLLLAEGATVGTYSSPHLVQFQERIRLQGEFVTEAPLCAAFARVERRRERLEARPRLTYFELVTLVALELFLDAEVSYVLLEVGLGGRLDAVNLVDADIAIITSIAFDHEAWLGNSLDSIAFEKAGIVRPEIPVVCGTSLPALIEQVKARQGQPLIYGRDFSGSVAPCSLASSNVGCALEAFKLLGYSAQSYTNEDWNRLIERLWLPGRFQQFRLYPNSFPTESGQCDAVVLGLKTPPIAAAMGAVEGLTELLTAFVEAGRKARSQGSLKAVRPAPPETGFGSEDEAGMLILDVAHNPSAALQLRALLENGHRAQVVLLLGMMLDKDIQGFVEALMPLVSFWLLADSKQEPRSCEAKQMKKAILSLDSEAKVELMSDLFSAEALNRVQLSLLRSGTLVVTGSFYIVSPVYRWLISQNIAPT